VAEHDYVYQLKPLLIPAAAFLILYPLILVVIHLVSVLPGLELGLLIGIYLIAALCLLAILAVGKSERVRISEQHIVFKSLMGTKVLKPEAIRRVAFYYDRRGKEIVQIRTESDDYYYLNEFYFPFPELMSDLDAFVQRYGLHLITKRKR